MLDLRILGLSLAVAFIGLVYAEDLPCMPRDVGIDGRSIVCVCNATYCDTITREVPEQGTYVVYTSTNDGQRFAKSYGNVQPSDEDLEDDENTEDIIEETTQRRVVLRLFQNTRFQFIEGFGGSVTDAAAINWRSLSDDTQTNFINTYFSSEGLEYNLIRVPIGGADFSTHPYTYNEYPQFDTALSNYSLTQEDHFLKLPMIHRAIRAATDEVKITASTWSPPTWMKTNERITGFGQIRREFYQTYADYHLRFLEEYAKANVSIWAITTTNEPINGIVPWARFNSLGWWPQDLARWVYNNLGPTIRNSPFNQTLILAIDDQRYLLPVYVYGMLRAEPRAFDYVDGIAVHYYGNFFPAGILSAIQSQFPDKFLISTEACEGPMPWDRFKVEYGSWNRARKYTRYILQDLNNYVVGWMDWNLCLDPNGGPNWAENFVDAPILVYAETDEFIKQPMYYAMGHFSKFIPRGSRRIRSARRSLLTIEHVALLRPDGNIVMVLQNAREREIDVRVRLNSRQYIDITMEPESIKTVEINI